MPSKGLRPKCLKGKDLGGKKALDILERGVYTYYMASQSAHTTPKTFRITKTQAALLEQPKHKARSSAIVRALLTLYLNGRLNIESAIEEDLNGIEQRQITRWRTK